jgi:hypothetical protein
MAYVERPETCLGIPIDYRLRPLLGTTLTDGDPFTTYKHAQLIEEHGHRLKERRDDISHEEIEFAKWLAKPETKGGVVIALQQPPKSLRYSSDHHETLKDSETLIAVDEVCKAVVGVGLEEVSCFDAFPYIKTPIDLVLENNEEELDEAYMLFLNMIREKQPDVVLCCYQSPHSNKYTEFESIGVGVTRDSPAVYKGKVYTCVNSFHPSYALTYREDNSPLRKLFLVEAAHAFRLVNRDWKESPWMTDLRKHCVVSRAMDQKGKSGIGYGLLYGIIKQKKG